MKLIRLIGLGLLFLLAYFLRNYHYYSVPRPGDSLDEYAYAWSGLGLIRLGLPLGWSYIETNHYQSSLRYVNVDQVYQSGTVFANPFYLHFPWLDHPPGVGLLTGGFAYLKGARVLEETGSLLIRKPLLILGSVSVVLLALLGWFYFDYRTGFLAGLIYAVSPLMVVGSRLPQAENAYLPLLFLSLIFLRIYQIKHHFLFFWLSALIAGIGIWFKIPAILISAIAALLLLPKIKEALIFLLISLTFGFGPLFAYGLALAPSAFKEILLFHSQRSYGIGLSAIFQLFIQSKVTGSISLTDGWLLFGWFAWFSLRKKLLLVSVLSTILMFLLQGSEFYGWYLFPLWPWLFLAIAILLLRRPTLAASLGITLPLVVLSSKLFPPTPFLSNLWRILLPGYLLLLIIGRPKPLIRLFVWLIFFLSLFLSVKYCLWLTPATWPSVT